MSNTKRPRNPQLSSQQQAKATPLIVGLVVLVCVGAIVALSLVLKGGDDDSSEPAAAASDTSVAQTSAPPTDSASTDSTATPMDCTEAPAAPGQGEQFDEPPSPDLAEDSTWVANVTTNCGDITLELDGKAAPQTVSSFIFLAQKGFYDDSPCHRLTTSGLFVLQCGDPTGTGSGGPGYGYGIENAPKDGSFPRGTLAMARATSPDSNGSQFFMVYNDTTLPTDGGGYSIFGTVTKGLDLLDALAAQGVDGGAGDGAPAQPISILSVTVEKK